MNKYLLLLVLLCTAPAYTVSKEDMLIERVKQGQCKEVEKLLKLGAYVNTLDEHKRSPLHYAAQLPASVSTRMVKLLISHGALKDGQDEDGRLPLHYAAQKGLKGAVSILAQGVDVNVQDNYGCTALYNVTENYDMRDRDYLQMLQLLINHGADVSLASTQGRTPLNAVVCNQSLEATALLLAHGADHSAPSASSSLCPVHNAALYLGESDHEYGKQCLELLFDSGANINAVAPDGDWGKTVLEIALRSGCSVAHLEWLLERGADISIMMTHKDKSITFWSDDAQMREKLAQLGISDTVIV